MQVFVVRADFGKNTEVFKLHGYAGISWFDDPLPGGSENNRDTLRQAYETVYTDHGVHRASQNIGQIFRFLNEIHPGDVVLTPYLDGTLLVGRAKGKPYFKVDGTSATTHRIDVDWNHAVLDRQEFSIPLQNTLRSMLTVFRVTQIGEVCAAAGYPYDGQDPLMAARKVSQETDTYGPVLALLLELHDKEFEVLVSYVLRTLGFEATRETGYSGDGGVDFEGVLTVKGIASVGLQVQVKRYKESRTISEPSIRSFRGALKRDYQGCFITLSEYTKTARDSARDTAKVLINLINGHQFIDILTEQYEAVIDLMRAEDQDDLATKLAFKRVLVPG